VPAIFIGFYIFLLASMYWAQPADRLIGLGLISLGAIAYFALGERSSSAMPVEP
jgi:hypothetical protein